MIHDHLCPMVTGKPPFRDDVTDDCLFCPLIALVRRDEEKSLRKGLWIGWAIGTGLMTIPIVVFVVTQ